MDNMYVLVDMRNTLSVREYDDMITELSKFNVLVQQLEKEKSTILVLSRTPLEGLVMTVKRIQKHVTLGLPHNLVEKELIVPVREEHVINDVKHDCNHYNCVEEYYYYEYDVRVQLITQLTSQTYTLLKILSKYLKLVNIQLLVKYSLSFNVNFR